MVDSRVRQIDGLYQISINEEQALPASQSVKKKAP
jgi:hypothetical protein